MKKFVLLFCVFLCSIFTFGQEKDMSGFTETRIESGSTFKKFKDGKLDSIIVAMAAVNYGNAIIISRTNDAILLKNAADENSLIKFEIKNKKQIKTLYYKNDPITIIESIDLDLQNLPKNAAVSTSIEDNLVSSYTSSSKVNALRGEMDDKSFKLFYFLNIPSNLDNLDAIFNSIGDFFSEEDALLKIFYGSYAEKFAPKALAYFKTDEVGKIKDGVLLNINHEKPAERNKYDIFKKGKIIKSGTSSLDDFQNIFKEYLMNNWEEE